MMQSRVKNERGSPARLLRAPPLVSGLRILLMSLAISTAAQADSVGLQFKAIKIPDLVEAVLKGILKRDYVISPEAGQVGGTVSLSIKSVERDQVVTLLNNSLAQSGITVIDRGGVFFVEKVAVRPDMTPHAATQTADSREPVQIAPPPEKEVAAYFPHYRTAEILSMAAKAAGATVLDGKEGAKEGNKRDAVVYSGTPEQLLKIAKLFAQIDKPLASVHVKAALLEVSEGNESVRSITAIFELLRGKLGIVMASGQQQANSISIRGMSLQALLSAVDGDNRFKYLSEPSIRVLDGETAKLTVGAEVPVRGNTTMSGNGQTVQGVEYRTAGVVITIEPRILMDSILLKVHQQVSSFSMTTTSGIDSPTMQKREAQTVVDVQDGEVLMIAGMDESRESQSGAGLSWLPKFLQSRTESKGRSQVLLLLEVKRHQRQASPI